MSGRRVIAFAIWIEICHGEGKHQFGWEKTKVRKRRRFILQCGGISGHAKHISCPDRILWWSSGVLRRNLTERNRFLLQNHGRNIRLGGKPMPRKWDEVVRCCLPLVSARKIIYLLLFLYAIGPGFHLMIIQRSEIIDTWNDYYRWRNHKGKFRVKRWGKRVYGAGAPRYSEIITDIHTKCPVVYGWAFCYKKFLNRFSEFIRIYREIKTEIPKQGRRFLKNNTKVRSKIHWERPGRWFDLGNLHSLAIISMLVKLKNTI